MARKSVEENKQVSDAMRSRREKAKRVQELGVDPDNLAPPIEGPDPASQPIESKYEIRPIVTITGRNIKAHDFSGAIMIQAQWESFNEDEVPLVVEDVCDKWPPNRKKVKTVLQKLASMVVS